MHLPEPAPESVDQDSTLNEAPATASREGASPATESAQVELACPVQQDQTMPAELDAGLDPPSRPRRWHYWVLGLVGMGAVVALGAVYYPTLLAAMVKADAQGRSIAAMASPMLSSPSDETSQAEVLTVNTVRPQRKTLVRTLEQPGSIVPWAQAELYAKASGYVRFLGVDCDHQTATELAARGMTLQVASPILGLAPQLTSMGGEVAVAVSRAPERDIGSHVKTGDLLLQIDVPELYQDIREKQSQLAQSEAELEEARTLIPTLEATIQVAKNQELIARADIRRYESEYTYRRAELTRTQEVARDKLISQDIVDEKQHQVNAALAGWESSRLKAEAAKAEYAVASSKLGTAHADIKLKEAKVEVARSAVGRARILAEYATLRAPFDGILTYRGVDDGDFVQNASTGQPKPLMTVTSIDKVKVILQVREQDAVWIQVGAPATLQVDARSAWKAQGHVGRTAGVLSQKELTLQVEIDVDNHEHKLMPGMYSQVVLPLQRVENAWAIPATAVFSRGGESYVIQVEQGKAHRHKVGIRFDDGKELEVVKLIDGREVPLGSTDELIVSNKGEIGEGQAVRSVLPGGATNVAAR